MQAAARCYLLGAFGGLLREVVVGVVSLRDATEEHGHDACKTTHTHLHIQYDDSNTHMHRTNVQWDNLPIWTHDHLSFSILRCVFYCLFISAVAHLLSHQLV